MPVNLSIKNAPDDIVRRLRLRAERHHRSLQGELLAIIEEAVRPEGFAIRANSWPKSAISACARRPNWPP